MPVSNKAPSAKGQFTIAEAVKTLRRLEADPGVQALHESQRRREEIAAAERRAAIQAWLVLAAVIMGVVSAFVLHWLLGVVALLLGTAFVLREPRRPL